MKYVNNYAVGDYVELRSLDWYERNHNIAGDVHFVNEPDYILYASEARRWCGRIVKIEKFINKHYIFVTDIDNGEIGSISFVLFDRILPKIDNPAGKFYVGQHLVPKSDSWYRKNQIDGVVPLGHIYYTSEHAKFNVPQCVITEAYPELDLYKVKCQFSDKLVVSKVWWSSDMFSEYEHNSNWYVLRSKRKYTTGEITPPKFNVGRKVKIREGLIVGNVYGGITYTETLYNKGLKPGTITTITKVNRDFSTLKYSVKDGGRWIISPEMLEAI